MVDDNLTNVLGTVILAGVAYKIVDKTFDKPVRTRTVYVKKIPKYKIPKRIKRIRRRTTNRFSLF